ncbi:DUF1593 domain-containing protein [Paludibaculum fermentans]|uniref:DUF1593 domain-containing protein n=1 Tax=Paludibaculum fermentans TaxID=1473598 RepID=UPI003EB8F517
MNRVLLAMAFTAFAYSAEKPRVLVLTDISSLTTGVREPDDGQSLVRFLLFSNEFDVEGIVATSNLGHGQVVRPELIREGIDAYAAVWPNLRRHVSNYPDPVLLRELVKAGQPVAGPKVPVEASVGEGKDTEGSNWIIKAAGRPDPRPLWILIWGGSADLAQALWRTRDNAELRRKLRVHAVHDQDSTGPWIRRTFPDVFYILRGDAVRGTYRGGDTSLVSPDWVETNVRVNHGPLGALYPNYKGGDAWSSRLGAVRGVKEGDTPTFLALIENGLNDPGRLELGGWGGRVLDARDAVESDAAPDDPNPSMISVYRWREAWQAEFQARLDWCVREPAKANHPPIVRLKVAGRKLDARGSSDPDGDKLTFSWMIYPRSERKARIEAKGAKAHIVAEPGVGPVHVVVAVRDAGTPALTRYARAEVQ